MSKKSHSKNFPLSRRLMALFPSGRTRLHRISEVTRPEYLRRNGQDLLPTLENPDRQSDNPPPPEPAPEVPTSSQPVLQPLRDSSMGEQSSGCRSQSAGGNSPPESPPAGSMAVGAAFGGLLDEGISSPREKGPSPDSMEVNASEGSFPSAVSTPATTPQSDQAPSVGNVLPVQSNSSIKKREGWTRLPEICVPFDHIELRLDGSLHFDKPATKDIMKKMDEPQKVEDHNPPVTRKRTPFFARLLRYLKLGCRKSQDTWRGFGPPRWGGQYVKKGIWVPQTCVSNDNLDWSDDGSLTIKGGTGLLREVSVVFDETDSILRDFSQLSCWPEPGKIAQDKNAKIDILVNHLQHGKCVWVTRSVGTRSAIDIAQTEDLWDARLAYFLPHQDARAHQPLLFFCNRVALEETHFSRAPYFDRAKKRLEGALRELIERGVESECEGYLDAKWALSNVIQQEMVHRGSKNFRNPCSSCERTSVPAESKSPSNSNQEALKSLLEDTFMTPDHARPNPNPCANPPEFIMHKELKFLLLKKPRKEPFVSTNLTKGKRQCLRGCKSQECSRSCSRSPSAYWLSQNREDLADSEYESEDESEHEEIPVQSENKWRSNSSHPMVGWKFQACVAKGRRCHLYPNCLGYPKCRRYRAFRPGQSSRVIKNDQSYYSVSGIVEDFESPKGPSTKPQANIATRREPRNEAMRKRAAAMLDQGRQQGLNDDTPRIVDDPSSGNFPVLTAERSFLTNITDDGTKENMASSFHENPEISGGSSQQATLNSLEDVKPLPNAPPFGGHVEAMSPVDRSVPTLILEGTSDPSDSKQLAANITILPVFLSYQHLVSSEDLTIPGTGPGSPATTLLLPAHAKESHFNNRHASLVPNNLFISTTSSPLTSSPVMTQGPYASTEQAASEGSQVSSSRQDSVYESPGELYVALKKEGPGESQEDNSGANGSRNPIRGAF